MEKEKDTNCVACEYFYDCLNDGGLIDITTGNDITKDAIAGQHYINKPGYDCQRRK